MRLIRVVASLLLALVLAGSRSAPAHGARCDGYSENDYIGSECVEPYQPKPPGGGDGGPGGGVEMVWVFSPEESERLGGNVCRLVPITDLPPGWWIVDNPEFCGVVDRDDVERWVRSLTARLRMPAPEIAVGPDPEVNEWKMAVVGHPLWLWTDAPRTVSTTAEGAGMRIEIVATLDRLKFAMGDGDEVTCTSWPRYSSGVRPGTPSPACGHVYTWPSLPQGSYDMTATAEWTATWRAMGYSGTVGLQSTASRDLPVGEVHAVIRR